MSAQHGLRSLASAASRQRDGGHPAPMRPGSYVSDCTWLAPRRR